MEHVGGAAGYKKRIAGLKLTATDVDWTGGDGLSTFAARVND